MGVENTFCSVGCGIVGRGLGRVNVPELIGCVITVARKDRGSFVIDGAGGLVECGRAAGITELSDG